MSYRRNVVQNLYVVHASVGRKKYKLRVQAESDEVAKAKAELSLRKDFEGDGELPAISIKSLERIDPEDYI